MAFPDLKVHKYRRIPGTQRVAIEKVVPYARLIDNKENPAVVYLQAGKIWSAGGDEIKPVPEWVEERIKTMNPKVIEEVGLSGRRVRKRANKEVEKDGDSSTIRRMGSKESTQDNVE